ncbi:protein VASCULATURE COMPLEXITY AND CONNECTIVITY-like [Rhododendron vialii]|uniref:protein VASCULATURE COMPLEXITY AND CONNECTIVITY-like n=1 Tax=Rhododendron vialii TaxID=182163 RepID=UPI00265D6723|nr:protein VASCULATURE COMPLEXITY AND CONNECTIVITY-like [Rhododendron vialii]
MSRTIGLLVCLSVVAMDITAGVLGIKAEAAQDQMKHVKLWLFECKEPSHEAFTLGAAAATLLGLAHVVANMLGTCTICSQQGTQKASPSRHCSLACLLLTWAALAVGLALLVIGTISNHKARATCGFTDRHYLFVGGILCFVHAGFSTGYYLTATA